MEQQHESDLVKRLEQLGIEVDVSPTVTTLTYEQIYTSSPTLEEALITFLGEALSRYEALRKWKANTLPIVTDVLFTKLPPLEVVSNFATRSPLGSCTFAQRTEVAILHSLRQIVHEASGGVVVVLAERFRVGPLQRRQLWEKRESSKQKSIA